jgi:hypothetical protein
MSDETVYNMENYHSYMVFQKSNFLAYKTSLNAMISKFDLYLDDNIKDLSAELDNVNKLLFKYDKNPEYYTDIVFEAQEKIIQNFLDKYRPYVKLYSLPLVDTDFEGFLIETAVKERQYIESRLEQIMPPELTRQQLIPQPLMPPQDNPKAAKRPKAEPEPPQQVIAEEPLKPNWNVPVPPKTGSDPELLAKLKKFFDSKKLS